VGRQTADAKGGLNRFFSRHLHPIQASDGGDVGALRAITELTASFRGADVLVLCYHRIRSRERFHSQIKALAEHGYSVLTMEEFTKWLKGSPLPSRPAALLTFDGCYDDQLAIG